MILVREELTQNFFFFMDLVLIFVCLDAPALMYRGKQSTSRLSAPGTAFDCAVPQGELNTYEETLHNS